MNNIRKKKLKVGRPRDGKKIKNVCSFRIEDKFKKIIVDKFGSVQRWIDGEINKIKISNK